MEVCARRARRFGAPVVVVFVGMWLAAGVARAAAPLGELTQLSGTAGCFTFNGNSEDGAGTCSQARGLAEGESATVSPDGANVYVGSYVNSGASLGAGFAVFSRNQSNGALTQLSGTAGCLTSDGSSSAGAGTCTKARGLIDDAGDGHDLVFTSDGQWAYMVAQNSAPHGTVLIFRRDPATGGLTQLAGSAGCISSDGSSQDGAGTCQTDPTLNRVSGVSISSNDRFLYMADYDSPTRVHVFGRDTTTGALTEIQCISEAPAPSGCSTGRVVGNSQFIALSPDGMHAYGAEYSHGLSVFDRDPSTGLLTQKAGTAGCITDDGKDNTGASTCATGRVVKGSYPLLISPNGATLYDPAGGDRGFSVFHVNGDGTLTQLSGANGCVTIDGKDNTGASTCTIARAVDGPYGGAISPDGSTLYVSQFSGAGGLAVFSLDPATGIATQLPGLAGCATTDGSSNGTAAQCADGTALTEGYGMSVSPDGKSVYQATDRNVNAGLGVYSRETAPACQSTTAATALGTPVTVSLRCSDADGDPITRSIVSGPVHGTLSAIDNAAGTVSYTPAAGFSGTDSFSFAASDGVNGSAAATATITVAAPVVTPLRVPALSALRASPHTFTLTGRLVGRRCEGITRANRHHRRCTRRIAVKVSYTLNVTARVTLTIERTAPGRVVKGRCVAPNRANRHHRRCTRVTARATLTRASKAGANSFVLPRRIGHLQLGPGSFRLLATPSAGGSTGKQQHATFQILR